MHRKLMRSPSNRTSLGLKLSQGCDGAYDLFTSNRTSLGLKRCHREHNAVRDTLLIEPVWD